MFVPTSKGVSSAVTTNAAKDALFQRIIWDIRECNSIEFTVPYTSISPWYRCEDSIGNVYVNVVNPLVCPESVSTTVDLAIEFYGTESMEFAYPKPSKIRNYVPLTYQGGLDPVKTKVDDFIHVNYETHKVVHLNGLSKLSPLYTKRCMGENIISLKERISRYSAYDTFTPTGEGTHRAYQPFQINMTYINSGSLVDPSDRAMDMTDIVFSAFCLNSGSMEYKFLSSFQNATVGADTYGGNMQVGSIDTIPAQVGWSGSVPTKAKALTPENTNDWFKDYGNSSIAYSRSDINGGVEIRVPQFHIDPYRSAANYMTTINVGSLVGALGSANFYIIFRTDIIGDIVVLRRVSKDFVLRNFISFGSYIL